MKLTIILTLLKSLSDLFNKLFDKSADRQKKKESASEDTAGKTFYLLLVSLVLVTGCSYVYTVSTPMTFDPNDYQPLTAGQVFTVPTDGIYFSNEAKENWIKAKIAEYEIRKRGFNKSDK